MYNIQRIYIAAALTQVKFSEVFLGVVVTDLFDGVCIVPDGSLSWLAKRFPLGNPRVIWM